MRINVYTRLAKLQVLDSKEGVTHTNEGFFIVYGKEFSYEQ